MIIVDCSALVDVLTSAPGSEGVRARILDDDLHAPAIIDTEVVSALRGLVRGHHLSVSRAHDALTDLEQMPVERWLMDDAARRRAFALRDTITPYDAAYVALAETLGCPLITRDARLARAMGQVAFIEVL